MTDLARGLAVALAGLVAGVWLTLWWHAERKNLRVRLTHVAVRLFAGLHLLLLLSLTWVAIILERNTLVYLGVAALSAGLLIGVLVVLKSSAVEE